MAETISIVPISLSSPKLLFEVASRPTAGWLGDVLSDPQSVV